jgi:hypothetical protein
MKASARAWVVAGLLLSLVQPVSASDISLSRMETGVRINKIRFDPNCDEETSRDCRNRELIVIRNDSNETKNLRGWTVHDLGEDHRYKVPRRTRVRPGERMILYSGRGQDLFGASINGARHMTYYYHWDRRKGVWDNDRDRATLKRPNGTIADRCGYGRSATSPKRC